MRPNYGIDAPTVVRNLLGGGLLLILVGVIVHPVRWFIYPGISLALTGLAMIYGSKVAKLKSRDRLLESLALRGDEQVLDVGCGRGLMLVGAAKRLTTGKATGIDLWQTVDQSGNGPEATLANAAAEGAKEKIEIQTGDARKLPFDDNTFDLILSSWALHNIPDKQGRRQAVQEIARVLKPGGRIAIMDINAASEYAETLRGVGMESVRREGPSFVFVTPSWTVHATKPAVAELVAAPLL